MIQTHVADGALTFEWGAQILNGSDAPLDFSELHVNAGQASSACGDSQPCEISGQLVAGVTIDHFLKPAVDHQVKVEYQGTRVLGNDWHRQFSVVDVASSGTLEFPGEGETYVIGTLSLGHNATVRLAPGDYWIDNLKLGSSSKIELLGEGPVRLLVNSDIVLPSDARINATRNADQLFIYGAASLRLENKAEASAVIFVQGNTELGNAARIYGSLTTADARLGSYSRVIYASTPPELTSFDRVCSGDGLIGDQDGDGIADALDPDRDGDGIDNRYEFMLGTSATDPASTPDDDNHNAIPDDFEGFKANQCLAAFDTGLQTHGENGSVFFDYNAQLLGDDSTYLNTSSIELNQGSSQLSCYSGTCRASEAPAPALDIGEYKTSDATADIKLASDEVLVLGTDDPTRYRRIQLQNQSHLTFAPKPEYRIKSLDLKNGSTLELPPGDYWIENLEMHSSSNLKVVGEGTVRLFVRESLDVKWSANANVGDSPGLGGAHKLFVYSYSDIRLHNEAEMAGYLFAAGDIGLDHGAVLYGGANAANVRLKSQSLAHRSDDALASTDFGFICDLDSDSIYDGFDEDVDGDGINNVYEEQVGTDSYDADDVPSDMDSDGIPDSIDPDRDGDGVDNAQDMFPDDSSESSDLDGDGIGDNGDPDRDGDGISNDHEEQLGFDPEDAGSTPPDLDGDRIPDALDDDIDGDGFANGQDAFPNDATEWSDLDGDGTGDNSDPDKDGDGISNNHEEQLGFDPDDDTHTPPDQDGDGMPDTLDQDIDGDGVANAADPFPRDPTEWSDLDGDGIGDNSDPDRDGDGISNNHEEQLGYGASDAASTPPDLDGDRLPDALDDDIDGDGVLNDEDAFPYDGTETADLDGDGVGDNSDPDRDGDGIGNDYEQELGFDPDDSGNTPPDLDGDGIPDALDADRDGDGIDNADDAFADDAAEWEDLDGDGIGNNSDPDRDGDGISNAHETQLGFDPDDPAQAPADLDGDALPDALDDDIDGDSVANDQDLFPRDATEWADLDGDGVGDNSDPDRDGDGISNEHEQELGFEPDDPSQVPADLDDDAVPDALDSDMDGDGVSNDQDVFPEDATESSDLDGDGIGDNSDEDRDGDGIANALETQLGYDPDDAANVPSDLDGDGMPDALDDDRDGDGFANASDAFPDDASEWNDLDTDGIGDNSDSDRDGDGASNEEEQQEGTDPDDPASFPDTTPPQLSLHGDAERSTNQSAIALSGSAYDDQSGIATIQATSSQYPGSAFSVALSSGVWQTEVPLEPGSNIITITASDAAGNQQSVAVVVDRQLGDTVIDLVITSPGANSVVQQPEIVVQGVLISEERVLSPTVSVNGIPAELSQTEDPTRFSFLSSRLTLSEGTNIVTIAAVVNDKNLQRTLPVIYQSGDNTAPSPQVTIRSPLPNRYLADTSFSLFGTAESFSGNLTLKINGYPVQLLDGDGGYGRFEQLLSFEPGQGEMAVLIEASDGLNQVSAQTVHYYRDITEPVVMLDNSVAASPVENLVHESPYRLSGTVIENNLSAFFINGQQVALQPGNGPGEYRFNAAVNVNGGSTTPVSLEARDLGGNTWRSEYLFSRDATLNLELLLPSENAHYLSSGDNLAIEVSARLSGGMGTETATATIQGDGVSVAQSLTVGGGYATGELEMPGQPGDYKLQVSVRAPDSSVLASTTRTIRVSGEEATPVAILDIEPGDQAAGVGPSDFITVFFNRKVAAEDVSLEVRETANGLSYVDQDPPGVDSLFAVGHRLEQVSRNYEAVPGTLSLLPDGKTFTYYPDRDFAYNAEVFVSVNVGDEELSRTRFRVRPLPTFVEGGVFDQLGQPVVGVRVEVPELGLSTTTSEDGAFAFGYGESAARNIPSGRFRLRVNAGLHDRTHGDLSTWINLQAGIRNYVGRQLLPTLNRNIAFGYLQSGRQNVINGNELMLDTTSATLQFPNRRNEGEAHVQFTQIGSIPYSFMDFYMPPWMYSVQPSGIRVEGNLKLSFAVPAYQGSHDYAPTENEKVVLMGVDPTSQLIRPFGVGEMRNLRIHSLGRTDFEVLDLVSYARVMPDQQELLTDVVEGRVSLRELTIRLQSYRLKIPEEYQQAN